MLLTKWKPISPKFFPSLTFVDDLETPYLVLSSYSGVERLTRFKSILRQLASEAWTKRTKWFHEISSVNFLKLLAISNSLCIRYSHVYIPFDEKFKGSFWLVVFLFISRNYFPDSWTIFFSGWPIIFAITISILNLQYNSLVCVLVILYIPPTQICN